MLPFIIIIQIRPRKNQDLESKAYKTPSLNAGKSLDPLIYFLPQKASHNPHNNIAKEALFPIIVIYFLQDNFSKRTQKSPPHTPCLRFILTTRAFSAFRPEILREIPDLLLKTMHGMCEVALSKEAISIK